MRTKKEIIKDVETDKIYHHDGYFWFKTYLEVLIDIRDELRKTKPKRSKKNEK